MVKPHFSNFRMITGVFSGLFKFFLHFYSSIEPPHDKPNKMTMRPAKTQISLGIRPVWSESSLCAQWVAKGPSFLHADSEDSDQTGRMPRLIWVFAGRPFTSLVLSRGGSFCISVCFLLLFYIVTDGCRQTEKHEKLHENFLLKRIYKDSLWIHVL